MPAESERQATFMRLVGYYKTHGEMPPGTGRASAAIQKAAAAMSAEDLRDFAHLTRQKRRGTILTGDS